MLELYPRRPLAGRQGVDSQTYFAIVIKPTTRTFEMFIYINERVLMTFNTYMGKYRPIKENFPLAVLLKIRGGKAFKLL